MAIEVCSPGRTRLTASKVVFPDGGIRCSFSYTEHLDALIRCWSSKYHCLKHIDMDRVVLSLAKCRTTGRRGSYANITSLRFPYGSEHQCRPGYIYRWPKILKNGREALYLIKFYLPRFHNLSFEDKVATILHELHHIDPKFNGEFRNFGGRNWAHGSSQKTYEKMFESLKRDILNRPGPLCRLFLKCRFATLLKRFGDVYGDRYYNVGPVEEKLPVVS